MTYLLPPATLPWLAVCLMAFHAQRTVLTSNGGGFDFVAHLRGLPGTNSLPLLTKLAMYRRELLAAGVVAPLGGGLLSALMPTAWAVAMVALVSTALVIVLFIEVKCFWEVGAFLPLSVLRAGLGDVNRDLLADYLRRDSIVRLGVMFVIVVALALSGVLLPNGVATAVSWGIWSCVFGVAIVAWIPALPPNPYDASALVAATKSFIRSDRPTATREPVAVDPAALLARYRQLTNARVPNPPTALFGKARGYDVIVIVLETAPAQCLDLSRPLSGLPTFELLRQEAFCGLAHHSTYPYTTRAIFSIYSGWYPSNERLDFIPLLDSKYPHLVAPGLIRSARNAGYRTALFNPDPVINWEHDSQRYEALGFEEIHFADRKQFPKPRIEEGQDARRAWRKAKDEFIRVVFSSHVAGAVQRDRPYLFAFHPQYSHGPWPGVGRAHDASSMCKCADPLFSLIDEWVGEVVDLLKKANRLHRTLIVVTGDHGIRTRTEHPNFVGGALSDLSFRVPLLLYAPGVVEGPEAIRWMTSHVDIAPSVLDLLGIPSERDMEQGSPIWEEAAFEARTTFLFGKNYLGADGFVTRDQVAVRKYLYRTVFVDKWAGALAVDGKSITADPRVRARVAETLEEMESLQRAWAHLMVVT